MVSARTPVQLVAHAHSYEALERPATRARARRRARRRRRDRGGARRIEGGACDERAPVQVGVFDMRPRRLCGTRARTTWTSSSSILADAHAPSSSRYSLLERGPPPPSIVGDPVLGALFDDHLAETREQERLVEELLTQKGGRTHALKDASMMRRRPTGAVLRPPTRTPPCTSPRSPSVRGTWRSGGTACSSAWPRTAGGRPLPAGGGADRARSAWGREDRQRSCPTPRMPRWRPSAWPSDLQSVNLGLFLSRRGVGPTELRAQASARRRPASSTLISGHDHPWNDEQVTARSCGPPSGRSRGYDHARDLPRSPARRRAPPAWWPRPPPPRRAARGPLPARSGTGEALNEHSSSPLATRRRLRQEMLEEAVEGFGHPLEGGHPDIAARTTSRERARVATSRTQRPRSSCPARR